MLQSIVAGKFLRRASAAAILAALIFIAGFDSSARGENKPGEAPPAAPKSTRSDTTKCQGHDLLEEFKTSKPVLYRRVIAAGGKVPNANAVLWKVTKPGLKPSYLFGTIHVTDPRVTTFTKATKAALAEVGTIALEIADLSQDGMKRAMRETVARKPDLLVYTDGSRLDQKLTKREFEIASKALRRYGIPAQAAKVMKPVMIYLLMATPFCEQLRVLAGARVLDAKLAHHASKHGIAVIGLETLAGQMTALASIPEPDQVQLLKAVLAIAERREDLLETFTRIYQTRRLGVMRALSEAMTKELGFDMRADERFKEVMVVKRNRTMRDGALPLLEKGGAFIAVGALHLIGKSGLVALFRQEGYTVTAVD